MLSNLIQDIITRILAKGESKGRLLGKGMVLDAFQGKGKGKGNERAEASDEIERACPNGAVTEVASVPRSADENEDEADNSELTNESRQSADEKEDEAGNNELTKESDEKSKRRKSRRRCSDPGSVKGTR